MTNATGTIGFKKTCQVLIVVDQHGPMKSSDMLPHLPTMERKELQTIVADLKRQGKIKPIGESRPCAYDIVDSIEEKTKLKRKKTNRTSNRLAVIGKHQSVIAIRYKPEKISMLERQLLKLGDGPDRDLMIGLIADLKNT